MDDIVISARGVSKCYRVFDNARAQIAHAMWPRSRSGMQEVWALRDIDLEVRRGESVAIIGRNGSGKSTLLEIITGTLTPTSGEARVNGRISALLELGSGFNPEYTGRDNAILNGLLLGATRQRVLERFERIAEFAEIGAAMDRPVKTYSSGMVARLAFAVQVALDPEILIVDEALSVGDFFFQQKCFRHIRELREQGVTILFVSHDMGVVRDLCKTGLFLRNGRIDYFGDNLEAIRRYLHQGNGNGNGTGAFAHDAAPDDAPPAAALAMDRPLWSDNARGTSGSGKGRILAVGVFDAAGRPTQRASIGEDLRFRVLFRSQSDEPLHVSVVLKNKHDQVVTVAGSYTLQAAPPRLEPNEEAFFELTLCPMLEAGDYSFSVSLGQATAVGAGSVVDETPWLGPLKVAWDYASHVPPFYGMVGLRCEGRFVVPRHRAHP